MPMWKIRIVVPDSPASRSAVKEALAAQPVSYLRLVPDSDTSRAAGEVVVEIPEYDDITGVLSALHAISPQVFVSRSDEPAPASASAGVAPASTPGEITTESTSGEITTASTPEGITTASGPDDSLVPGSLPGGTG